MELNLILIFSVAKLSEIEFSFIITFHPPTHPPRKVSKQFQIELSETELFTNLIDLAQLDSTCPELGTAQPQLVLHF